MVKNREPDSKEFKRVKSYYNCFSSEAGQTVLKDLKQQVYNVQSYVPGDPYASAFNEGRRSIVAEIISTLKQSKHPELFIEQPDEYPE